MAKIETILRPLLNMIGCKPTDNIKDIEIRFNSFVPSPEFPEFVKLQEFLPKEEATLVKLSDPTSEIYSNITSGLLKKFNIEKTEENIQNLINQKKLNI